MVGAGACRGWHTAQHKCNGIDAEARPISHCHDAAARVWVYLGDRHGGACPGFKEQGTVHVQKKLILLPLLSLAACVHEPPIRLSPASTTLAVPRHVAHDTLATHLAASRSPCTGPASRRLTKARKDELFRQFAAHDGRPDEPPPPAKAPMPACRTAGR